jgi:hypothetical protein
MKIAKFSNRIYEDDTPELEFQSILSDISKNPDMEELYLRGNNVNSKQLTLLSEALSPNKLLRILDLSTNSDITTQEKEAVLSLKRIIGEHPNLTVINLSYTNINDSTLGALVENNSEEFSRRMLSINFSLSCNKISEQSLELVNNKLSPSSVLSLLSGNFTPKNLAFVDRHRVEALNKLNKNQEDNSAHSSIVKSPSFTPLASASSASSKRKEQGSPEKQKAEELFLEANIFLENSEQVNPENFINALSEQLEQLKKKYKPASDESKTPKVTTQ